MGIHSGLRCSAGAVIITPPLGTSLAGYFTDRRASGVIDDLFASALILEAGGSKAVWIACDLVAVPASFALPIREAIAQRVGIPVCAVSLSATHTHTGPATGGPHANQAYLQEIAGRIVDLAVAVDARLAPGTLEYGECVEPRFAFNRRYLMRDGSALTNPGVDNPNVVGPAGTVDPSLQVLKILDGAGVLQAVVVNCANHADTTDGDLVSADWPGHLRAKLQAAVGAPIPALVLNGAAGDVNHFDVMHHHVTLSAEESRRIGHGYAETALEAMKQAQPLAVDAIGVACGQAQVPYRHISDAELSEAQRTVAELRDDPEARLEGHLESQDIARGNKAVRLMFAQGIVDAAEAFRGRTQALEITVVGLGPLGIVGINGEVFTDIGLALKRESIFTATLVVELTNGSIGYLGTKKAYRQGGYETLWGGRVCDEVEDYVLATVSSTMAGMPSNNLRRRQVCD